jgi:hypothetical protein
MKKSIVVMVVFAASSALQAGAASLSLDQLVACAGITDSSARLACYDREVAPMARQVSGPTQAPAPVVRAPTPAAPPPVAPPVAPSFGQEQLAPEKRPAAREEDKTLHARLESQRTVGPGLFNLYLDNGQVWRHEDQVLGPYLRDGEAITIEKGALGSYKLSRDAGKSRNWIRVTRVR